MFDDSEVTGFYNRAYVFLYHRLTSENTVGVYDSLLNFAKLDGDDVAGQKNGEISGTVKEWV